MSGQGTGVPSHGNRNYRANGEQRPQNLRRGNRGSWGLVDNRPAMLATLDARFDGLGLTDTVPVIDARRPWREMPDAEVRVISRATVCPGCGIVPPRSAPCGQCW